MRLFIAIDFNELKDYFIGLQEQLPKNARLSMVKSFHLTLKFLGDVQPNNADEIIDSLKSIKFRPFPVFTDSIGIFPTENYIRVVWVGLKPQGEVIELQKQVDESLIKLFKKEKDFEPHITLCRVKHPQDKKAFVEEIKKIKFQHHKVGINCFRLVKSTLTSQGHVYEDFGVFNSS